MEFKVGTRTQSVTTIIETEADFINDCDFHIVAIGKTMIEEFILNNLQQGKLTKPTFIFWVEPFLASGQLLFVMPGDAERALELIKRKLLLQCFIKFRRSTRQDISD